MQLNGPFPDSGFTVKDLARRYRVSPDKIRKWIALDLLSALNTASALCGKPRYVVTPEALTAFERSRAAGQPKKPAKRRKRTNNFIDFFPDE
jgi:hypothetical protein